jgi:membrane protease YdiL (CAAX protease family)
MSRWWVADFYLALGVLAPMLAVASLVAGRHRLRRWFVVGWREVGVGLLGGVVQAVLTHVGYGLLASEVPALREQVIALYALMGTGLGPIRALPVLVVAVVVEEVVWRGVALEGAESGRGWWGYGLVSACLYTLAQAGSGSWALAVTAFGCGWVWWAARRWGRSLTTPVLMHLTWSLIVLVFLPLEST